MSAAGKPTANTLYRAAQDLIREGQPVFPCKASGSKAKAPLTKNGLKDASLDRLDLKRWWSLHKDAAIGLPTGIKWDVLDVDVKRDADGRNHLHDLLHLGLLNGCKRVVRTPSGGYHLYFLTVPNRGLTNKADATLGLDVRSLGGYVLAPPSFLETEDYSGAYEDMGDPTGGTDEPLLWEEIMNNLSPKDTETKKPIHLLPSERRASIGALREWVSNLKMGERNNGLYWAICRCIENGIDPHELVEAALYIGLTEDEVTLSITSAIRRAGLTVDELDSEADALFGS